MPERTAYKAEIKHLQILDEDGKLDQKLAKDTLTDEQVVQLYEHISLCRQYDEVAFKLQRSGRMGTYPQNKGQEAIAAAALPLEREDWIVPCYRENPALFLHGLPMEKILLHWMGDERGNQIPEDVHCLPIAIPIGTHMLHAVGIAWASKLRGDRRVSLTIFGDGATSEGDFHEAMNFATALKVPTVFICQNNHWAISVPRSKQTGSETIAQKGLAYGAECVQVDGNDVFAIFKATRDAVKRAREEGVVTLIETLTYRLGDHTTADDARRYRDAGELESWTGRDPLIRMRKYLDGKNLWSDEKQEALEAQAKQTVNEIVKRAEGIEKPTSDDIFDYTFESLPEALIRQRDTLRTHSLGQYPEQETLQGPQRQPQQA